MAANDRQVGGDHYKRLGQFQPWDVLQAWLTAEEYRGWQKGVAIAYLARERQKAGDADIREAGHHIEKLIETLGPATALPAQPVARGMAGGDERLILAYRALGRMVRMAVNGQASVQQLAGCLQAIAVLEEELGGDPP